jgi:hypothetical protein
VTVGLLAAARPTMTTDQILLGMGLILVLAAGLAERLAQVEERLSRLVIAR